MSKGDIRHKSNLGKTFSDEHKKKISLALLGKKKSKEHINNMRLVNLGKKASEETKEKMRKNNSGANNPNYKGGEYPASKLERNRFKKNIAKLVLKRDNYTCQTCGSRENLQVDHIQPWAEYIELRFNINNCRTLCMSCHYFITFRKPIPKDVVWGFYEKRKEI